MSGKQRDIVKFDSRYLNEILNDKIAITAENNFGKSNFSKRIERYRHGDYYAAIFKDFSRVLKRYSIYLNLRRSTIIK